MDLLNEAHSIEVIRVREDGGRVLRIRGMFGTRDGRPIPLRVALSAVVSGLAERVDDTEQREQEQEIPTTGTVRIRGIASSTGVDSYGTEMTLACLQGMARQFDRGVAYVPTHWEREWHEVIGETRAGDLQRVKSVVNPADPDEEAHVLWVDTDLDMSQARAQDLVKALRAKRQVGQSIGAWFLEILWVENARGELERVLVNEVELDHLAATRTPSNGDSDRIEILRSEDSDQLRELCARAVQGLAAPPRPQTRAEPAPEVRTAPAPTPPVTDPAPEAARSVAEPDSAEPAERSAAESSEVPEEPTNDRSTVNPLSEASAEEPPEEIDMTPEQIQELAKAMSAAVGSAVGEQVRVALQEAGIGSQQEPAATPTPEARSEQPAPVPTPAPRAEAAPAPAEASTEDRAPAPTDLAARIAELEAARAADQQTIARLLAQPVRHTGGPAMGLPDLDPSDRGRLAMGDLDPLIERAASEGIRPMVVRTVKSNTRVQKVLTALEPENELVQLTKRDLRDSLRALFRSYFQDGGFIDQQPAARARW